MSPLHPPIKLALIGLGRWGSHLLRNFLALPQATVVALADTNPQRLAQVRQQFALPDTMRLYDHWPTALALPELDAAVIATPASTHYAILAMALGRGLNVLTEKPMTLDRASSETLCHLAAAQGCQLVVDHTYLFHPAVQRGYELCRQQALGSMRYAYAARTNLGPVRPDVDALWDLAIHDVAILNHWLGQTPSHVAAWGQVWLQPQPQKYFPSGLRDVGCIRLTYGETLEAMIQVSWLNPDKQRRLGLVGDRGTLVFDEMAAQSPLTLYPASLAATPTGFVPSCQQPQALPFPAMEPLTQLCRHFLDCVQTNTPSALSSGQVATALVQVMEAVSEAVETGRRVAIG